MLPKALGNSPCYLNTRRTLRFYLLWKWLSVHGSSPECEIYELAQLRVSHGDWLGSAHKRRRTVLLAPVINTGIINGIYRCLNDIVSRYCTHPASLLALHFAHSESFLLSCDIYVPQNHHCMQDQATKTTKVGQIKLGAWHSQTAPVTHLKKCWEPNKHGSTW